MVDGEYMRIDLVEMGLLSANAAAGGSEAGWLLPIDQVEIRSATDPAKVCICKTTKDGPYIFTFQYQKHLFGSDGGQFSLNLKIRLPMDQKLSVKVVEERKKSDN